MTNIAIQLSPLSRVELSVLHCAHYGGVRLVDLSGELGHAFDQLQLSRAIAALQERGFLLILRNLLGERYICTSRRGNAVVFAHFQFPRRDDA